MTILEAINAVARGYTVISNAGKYYTPEQLAPKWYGKHYASYNSAGITEQEQRGEWRIDTRE